MRLLLTGRQVEITPALRTLVEIRLVKLERMLGDVMVSVQLVLAREKYRYLAELSVHGRGGHVMHGVGSTSSWSTSLSAAVEKVMQQAQTLKGKWRERQRRGRSSKTRLTPAPAQAASPRPRRVVRTISYPVKPMTVEEAALEVEGARNEFLVFRNASTDTINVIYRRKNGGLGLIEPEI